MARSCAVSAAVLMRTALGANVTDCDTKLEKDATCAFESCHDWRGPTKCSSGHCHCQEGFCPNGDLTLCMSNDPSLLLGPHDVKFAEYSKVPGMDSTNRIVDVWYPVGAEGQQFPLIVFAHGFTAGGSWVTHGFSEHLSALSAFGYVVAAMEACNVGCSDLASLSGDPPGFKNFYKQQLKVIDYAREQAAQGADIWSSIDFDIGVGVAGHSMGGQATLFSSSSDGEGYGIKAAVMHHAYTHKYPAPLVPFLAFTGTSDGVAASSMTESFFNAEGAHPVKGLVNKKGTGHNEPDQTFSEFNPKVTQYTAAWFKVFLDETPQADSNDYHDLLFGTGAKSLCNGGDGELAECTLYDAKSIQV